MMKKSELSPADRIILALDFNDYQEGKSWIPRLKTRISTFKIGPVMFLQNGFSGIRDSVFSDIDIFLDLKFHDIPNTVMNTVPAIVDNNISMFTIHSLGGFEMMRSVCEKINDSVKGKDTPKPMILAVTVLTSHNDQSLNQMGINSLVKDEVLKLASLAAEAGIDGLVCSGLEVEMLRREFGDRFKLVVPGVRMNDEKQDQKRVVTPYEAISRGADYIVVGRSVTQSRDPEATVDMIIESLNDCCREPFS